MSRPALPFVLVLALVVAALAACGDGDPGSEPDATPQIDAIDNGSRYYEHAIFDDPEDCPDDPIFNCYPSLELCQDGTATMLVTDIVNGGTYTETATTISTVWNGGDVPRNIDFEIQQDGSLVDDWQGETWSPATPGFSTCD